MKQENIQWRDLEWTDMLPVIMIFILQLNLEEDNNNLNYT